MATLQRAAIEQRSSPVIAVSERIAKMEHVSKAPVMFIGNHGSAARPTKSYDLDLDEFQV